MSEDPIICYCFGTARNEVRAHFSRPGARLDDLIEQTRITTKCTACALDLDILLDEIQAGERLDGATAAKLAAKEWGFLERVERVDSGFLLNRDGVRTHIRLANYPPFFQDGDYCSSHRYNLKLFDNAGKLRASRKGKIGVGEEKTIELGAIAGCPDAGWFLIRLMPTGPGHYGTLRPQAILDGGWWTAAYHTQFHSDASRSGRRAGTPLRTVGRHTHATVSLINGARRPTSYKAVMTGPNFEGVIQGKLAGNGAVFLDIDKIFENLPENSPLILRVASKRPTRKNLINHHPDGSLGVEHFPNLV